MVALMEEARAIGMLAKEGFRPKRTLIYAAWDAEEPGLLGSTEWVERHQARLRESAVAYLNLDTIGRVGHGVLFVRGTDTSPTLNSSRSPLRW